MIASRDIKDLHPVVKAKCIDFIAKCHDEGIDVIITSTYRDKESQDALYAQGRTTNGQIVTNAKGGQSFHNYRLAFDFVPIENGKCVWNNWPLWNKCGLIGESCGLEWAGRWQNFRETAHMQWTDGLTLKDLQAGKLPKEK